MKAVRTPETNVALTLEGAGPDRDLPACRAMLYDPDLDQRESDAEIGYVTTWMPDEQDASRLEAGAAIELIIRGKQHPPVSLRVTEAVLPSREMIRRDHVDRALGHLYAQIKERVEKAIDQIDREQVPPHELVDSGGEPNAEAVGLPDAATMAQMWSDAVDATNPDAHAQAAKLQVDEIRALPETDEPDTTDA